MLDVEEENMGAECFHARIRDELPDDQTIIFCHSMSIVSLLRVGNEHSSFPFVGSTWEGYHSHLIRFMEIGS